MHLQAELGAFLALFTRVFLQPRNESTVLARRAWTSGALFFLPGCPLSGGELSQDRLELVEADRFREVMVKARIQRFASVLDLAMAGDRHEHDVLAPRRGAHL